MRAVVQVLHERAGHAWAGILFVESGGLVLGPQAGEQQPERRTRIPVTYTGRQVAELVVDDAPEEDRMILERVAGLISAHCLVGWDTGGETWSP